MRSRRNLRLRCSTVVALAAIAAAAPGAASSDVVPGPPPVLVPVTLPAPLGAPPASPPSSSSAPSSTSQAASATTAKVSLSATPALRNAIVAEINRIRRAHHLRLLRVSSALVRAGTEHARALATAGLFTHSWPDGELFPRWIRGFYPSSGYRNWSAGENLLWSVQSLTSASAVRQWLDSPMHRHVLLLPSWREVGVGTVRAVGAPGAYGGQNVDLAAAEFGMRTK
jgi:uncharacterized protein YkwD